ncbi:MAG: polysaccharide pyruvyl transferase family protein [Treponemataceae bacterium]
MKYGILRYKNEHVINIGDAIQILAIKNIYTKMNIPIEDVVEINYNDLECYDGDKVLLPIAFPLYGLNSHHRITCFSRKIIPVFLALSILEENLGTDDIAYLKKFAPIGCRDEFTFKVLEKFGILAYLNGCPTLTLDNMSTSPKNDTVYCVDIPEAFSQYMPKKLKDKLKYTSHIFKNVDGKTDDFASVLLTEYCNNAILVITSRLHCAVPCYAMGIPVIFISSEFSYRYTWLEDFLPVYTPDLWSKIDWNGSSISNNKKALALKRDMMKLIQNKLTFFYNLYNIKAIYNMRNKRAYTRGPITHTISYIENNVDRNKVFDYAIWGITQVADEIIHYMNIHYPNANLKYVIDAKKKEAFHNITPTTYDKVKDIKDIFVFVTADAANIFAMDFFNKIKKLDNTYFFSWSHITCKNENSETWGGVYQDFASSNSNSFNRL